MMDYLYLFLPATTKFIFLFFFLTNSAAFKNSTIPLCINNLDANKTFLVNDFLIFSLFFNINSEPLIKMIFLSFQNFVFI